MAVVLTSDEDGYFSSSLRRSHSQPKFTTERSKFHTSASTSQLSDLLSQASSAFPGSTTSSALSSPQTIHIGSDLSCSSTPATNFSLASDCGELSHLPPTISEDVLLLPPHFENASYFSSRLGNFEPPPPSPQSGLTDDSSPNQHDDSAATSRPGSPDVLERAEDDIALRAQPSRHVDYFSHDWREEDIWSSWKLIVSRRGDYNNAARLENASWRTWMKSRNNLSTVSAETLNWLKDHDVTWLYGPLQTGTSSFNHTSTSSNSAKLSKSGSFAKNKKPILKKRSMSEIMLQRSISSSSLLKQAAAAVQAQQQSGSNRRIGRRPGLERANTDYITFPFSSRGMSHEGTSVFTSTRSSGIVSPNSGRKHIHFNEQVSQCIAVEIKEEDEEDDAEADRYQYDNSDSDDGAIMMKRTKSKKRRSIMKKPARRALNRTESKTIAMLPSTTLKYREDTPEPPESAMKHTSRMGLRSPTAISPSSSQETLRPSKKSGKLFFAGDDDEDDDDDDADDNNDDSSSRRDDTYSSLEYTENSNDGGSSGGGLLRRTTSSKGLSSEPTASGMRRTASGMFMPVEDDEGQPGSGQAADDGLIGRIIETKEAAATTADAFGTHHRQKNSRLQRSNSSRGFQGLYD